MTGRGLALGLVFLLPVALGGCKESHGEVVASDAASADASSDGRATGAMSTPLDRNSG